MNESKRIVEYDRLNLFGKAVFLGGSAVRLAANAIDTAVRHAADAYVDAEKAFRQGLDEEVEDAKILREE